MENKPNWVKLKDSHKRIFSNGTCFVPKEFKNQCTKKKIKAHTISKKIKPSIYCI